MFHFAFVQRVFEAFLLKYNGGFLVILHLCRSVLGKGFNEKGMLKCCFCPSLDRKTTNNKYVPLLFAFPECYG